MKRSDKPQTPEEVSAWLDSHLAVPFNAKPKRKLKPFGHAAVREQDEFDRAVLEAEFIARLLEHPAVTSDQINTVRALIIGACLYIVKTLDTHAPDPEMVRDIYPYARLIKSDSFRPLFERFYAEVARETPMTFKALMKSKGGKR